MDTGNLNKLLEQLQDEIRNTKVVDERGAELLRTLDDDIHTLLEKSTEYPDLVARTDFQRLEEAFYHFEATHPKLTVLISRLMESLNNVGI
ncbi:DUF4404 family protein [Leptolinea tardivitalis]|uniref:DUF4404 domain-containing protein n=1 Tax=Leptolinea tardivitalis TaxID=229920 RepID=A0A0P6XH56_9CHLR|nr:DUF4404 family protein [Leptolinea tardivitalis]KPL70438.1 hypothetical protein ADM99_14955 [Leptolinea tardivitalis]GAP22021.1 hypothetical protein LTAR_02239 [Leptolinea tardivitalis]